MKTKLLKITALALAVLLLLTGCGYSSGDDLKNQDKNADDPKKQTSITAAEGTITNPGDDVFTLGWLSDGTLNPFKSMTGENAAVSSLMYEGLFDISPDFQAVPRLCTDYSVDGLTYTFNIKGDVDFNDGTRLTADDAVYSIERARNFERFSSRLKCIDTVDYVNDTCFTITLTEENYSLPVLLDIPIVKRNTGSEDIPTGSGPYVFDNTTGTPRLVSGASHSDNPTDVIYLYDISSVKPSAAMSGRDIDLILYDPLKGTPDVYIDHEIHYYDTTVFQYIGFDTGDYILSDPEVRRAISHLINRQAISEEVLNETVTAAPLALSPSAPGYSERLEFITEYSIQTFSNILSQMGVADNDGDGWLEYGGRAMSFKLIVCNSDSGRLSVADRIAGSLAGVGINVTVKAMPYEEYTAALEKGNFDMYFAEVRLPANFDMTEILGRQGSMNYGDFTLYDDALASYLAAKTDEAKTNAAEDLCRIIYEKAPIIPICYNKKAVITARNTITGVNPSQQNLFWGLTEWSFNDGKKAQNK